MLAGGTFYMAAKDTQREEITREPLAGLTEYLNVHQYHSIFDQAASDSSSWCLFHFGNLQLEGKIQKNDKYEFDLISQDNEIERVHKVKVNFLCPLDSKKEVLKQMKKDKALVQKVEGPHFSPRFRHHIKNKSLFPLMNRKEVLFFSMLEGEVLRGIITGFSRYEIYLNMKKGIPVILMRHSIVDVRDKKGRCYLKEVVEKTKKYW